MFCDSPWHLAPMCPGLFCLRKASFSFSEESGRPGMRRLWGCRVWMLGGRAFPAGGGVGAAGGWVPTAWDPGWAGWGGNCVSLDGPVASLPREWV